MSQIQNFDLIATAYNVMKFFVPFLFALCFHEFAHAYVARLRGDRTAEIMGRLTLNPLAHADPIGTVLFPIMATVYHLPLFGWAKPVPVDVRNLKNPKNDMFWVALAGPASNLLLAFVGAIFAGLYLRFASSAIQTSPLGELFRVDIIPMFIRINVMLAVFNMIPLHPLDGAKVIARFLPPRLNARLEDMQAYSSILLVGFLIIGGSAVIAIPVGYLFSFFLYLANGVAFA